MVDGGDENLISPPPCFGRRTHKAHYDNRVQDETKHSQSIAAPRKNIRYAVRAS